MTLDSTTITKQIISITEMAQMLQLSRARFYQLLDIGFFPKPLQDERSNRPYYDLELQQKCIECRQSGVGVDGSFMLFYSPRKKANGCDVKKNRTDPRVKELTETLQSMGLDVSVKQIQKALNEVYPDGIENDDQGLVIRELFRHFKSE